jgi:hypothetical protein
MSLNKIHHVRLKIADSPTEFEVWNPLPQESVLLQSFDGNAEEISDFAFG